MDIIRSQRIRSLNLIVILVSAISPSCAIIIYHQPGSQPLQLYSPYLTTQRYLAVPGKIVEHITEAPRNPIPFMPRRKATFSGHAYESGSGRSTAQNYPVRGLQYSRNPIYPPDNSEMQSTIVHKYVSVHLPPKEMEMEFQKPVILRPKLQQPQKHVNIIFIKAPVIPPHRKTEIILPEPAQQKTLIYVLVKRSENVENERVRIRQPTPTPPAKPQVYYIRYKENKNDNRKNLHR